MLNSLLLAIGVFTAIPATLWLSTQLEKLTPSIKGALQRTWEGYCHYAETMACLRLGIEPPARAKDNDVHDH